MAKPLENIKPAIFLIFGITGDLSQRYLLPALFELVKLDLIDEDTTILGISRSQNDINQVLSGLKSKLDSNDVAGQAAFIKLMSITSMVALDLSDAKAYLELNTRIERLEEDKHACLDRIFYLAIPPSGFNDVIKGLDKAELNGSCKHNNAQSRLLIEKPFGQDYPSAEQLYELITPVFANNQLYLIDHYLAKETVENLLTFRFKNDVFEPIWNSQHIDSIEIYAHEALGIEGRSEFYERLGALRDFIQSHLLQILSLVTLDKPESTDSNELHRRKLELLKSVTLVDDLDKSAQRGQYKGYREEVGNPTSTTETYAKLRLNINSPRWQGTKVSVETGKAMSERKAGININFKGEGNDHIHFRIQPNEGIDLEMNTKLPGSSIDTDVTSLDYAYGKVLSDPRLLPDAYERVIVSAILGDQSRFASIDEVLACWKIVQPVLLKWSNNSDGIIFYEQGTNPVGAIS